MSLWKPPWPKKPTPVRAACSRGKPFARLSSLRRNFVTSINMKFIPMTRRRALKMAGCGFGYVALAGLLDQVTRAETMNPLAPKPPQFAPKAKRVIFLFMHGGPSHVDTFDPK